MLNLAFQWTANLNVEKGFGVTAQSLLPAEGAFARKADYPIPQPVQRESQKSLAGLPIPQLVQSHDRGPAHDLRLAGLPIPQLVQSEDRSVEESVRLAGLPIPQLVQ